MARGPFYAPGFYLGIVQEIGFTQTKNSGKDMIVVVVEVTEEFPAGCYAEEDAFPVSNRYNRTVNLVIGDDRSLDYIMLKLRNAGWRGQDFSDIDQLVGNRCRLKCEHEERDNGEMWEQWDLVLPARSRNLSVEPTVAMKLNALFDRRLTDPQFSQVEAPAAATATPRSRRTQSGPPDYGNPPPAGPGGPGPEEDDIPF